VPVIPVALVKAETVLLSSVTAVPVVIVLVPPGKGLGLISWYRGGGSVGLE